MSSKFQEVQPRAAQLGALSSINSDAPPPIEITRGTWPIKARRCPSDKIGLFYEDLEGYPHSTGQWRLSTRVLNLQSGSHLINTNIYFQVPVLAGKLVMVMIGGT